MFLTQRTISELRRMRAKLDGMRGDGVSNHARNITIAKAAQREKSTPFGPRLSVVVHVDTNAPGGGKYLGRLRTPRNGSISDSTTLAESDFGDFYGPCLILNSQETGQNTHDLTMGTQRVFDFIGVVTGRTAEGWPVVTINGLDIKDCPAP